MARHNRKAAVKVSKQAPSKTYRGRREAATMNNSPGIGAPYFAHEALDPAIYPANARQPVGGPCPNSTLLELEGDESDDAVLDAGSEADGESDNSAKTQKANKSTRTPVSPLRDVKRIRVKGGRAPAPRRILADLDSDDEVIVKMKEEKFTDKQIAARLREEGRVNYHYKTISSRWIRIKRALEKKQDQDLDDQLTDWHEGDDYVLLQAITAADREVYRLKQAAQERKWRLVSVQMKEIKPSTNYSKDACRNRFEALENGTATIPPELDDDPEKRAVLREVAKDRAEKNIANRREERAEEPGNVRAVNGASKRIQGAVTETPAVSSRVDNTRPVRSSLPVNYVVDDSDVGSGLSDLDSTFRGSSASSGDVELFPGKPTGLSHEKVSIRDNSKAIAIRSTDTSTLRAPAESLFPLVARIITSDPEFGTPQNKATLISSKHQTSRRQRHPIQQEDTSSTGSEGETAIQDAERFLKSPSLEECTESLSFSGGPTKSRNTSELLAPSTVKSPVSSSSICSSASVAGEQTPLPLAEEDTSPLIAAQLLLELRKCGLVEGATHDQTTKRVEAERAAAMENRSLSQLELADILYNKDNKLLRAACGRLFLNTSGNKSSLIRHLRDSYNRGVGVDDPIYSPSDPESIDNLEITAEHQQGGSASNAIHIQAPLEGEASPEATDESQHSRTNKKVRRSAPTAGEGIDAIDFAYRHGSEQIGLGQRRPETPLPHIGFGFDSSNEYVEAKAKRDKKRKESLAEEMRQRRESGPPTANLRETRRGPGGIGTDQRPSTTSRNPNVAPMGILPTTTHRADLPKPAFGYPGARHELAPPLPSEFNPSNFPTSEYNLAQSRHYLRQQGYRVNPNATAPAPSAADDREARAPVQVDHTRDILAAYAPNVPQPEHEFTSMTGSLLQPGAYDHTTSYMPTPQQYGANMGQFGATAGAMGYSPTAQQYGGDIPIMGQLGGDDHTMSYAPTTQQYGGDIPVMGQSSATAGAMGYTPTTQQYGVNMGQSGATAGAMGYRPTVQQLGGDIRQFGATAYGMRYTPTTQQYGVNMGQSDATAGAMGYMPTIQQHEGDMGQSSATAYGMGYTPTTQQHGGDMGQPSATPYGMRYTPTTQHGGDMGQSSATAHAMSYTPTIQQYGGDMGQSSATAHAMGYTPTTQQYGGDIPIMGQSGGNGRTMTNMPQFYATNNPSVGGPNPDDLATMNVIPFSATNNSNMGEPRANDATMTAIPSLYATNNPMLEEADEDPFRVLNSPAPQHFESSSPVISETVSYDSTMNDTPTPQGWGIENPILAGNVQNPTPQFQHRTQAQPNIPPRRPSAIAQPGRHIRPPGGGLYPTTQTDSSIASGTAFGGRDRDHSRASRHGGSANVAGPQASNIPMANPNTPSDRQYRFVSEYGSLEPANHPRERVYYRVRIRNLPYNASREELQRLIAPHAAAIFDLSQIRGNHAATLFFEDAFEAEAAALAVDGVVHGSSRLRAERVDQRGFVIPIGAMEL